MTDALGFRDKPFSEAPFALCACVHGRGRVVVQTVWLCNAVAEVLAGTWLNTE